MNLPYIYVERKEGSEFVKDVLKLFLRFVKERGLIKQLYNRIARWHGQFYVYSYLRCTSLAFDNLDFGLERYKLLVLSQLWRFYILEHIDELPASIHQRLLLSDTIKEIKANGDRSNGELKELFKKHNIIR